MYDLIKIDDSRILSSPNIKEYNIIINQLVQLKRNIIYLFFKNHKNNEQYTINPLFLIQLLNYHKINGLDKRIFIDITYLQYSTQLTMITHLKQYSDYQLITKKHEPSKTNIKQLKDKKVDLMKKCAIGKITLYYSTNKYYEGVLPNLLRLADLSQLTAQPSNKITLQSNKTIDAKDYNFVDDNKKPNLNYLPIINITNLKQQENYSIDNDEENYLYELYNQVKIDYKYTKYKVLDIWDKIFKTYLQIHMDDDTLNSFKTIITETVSNIQEHTDKQTNGYISFYKNTNTKYNEFYICDDYEEGFLNSYLNKLKDEKDNVINILNQRLEILQKDLQHNREEIKLLEEEHQVILSNNYSDIKYNHNYTPILKEYSDDIATLEKNTEEDDQVLLKKLFNYKKSTNMHKASRLIMHFGIPSLMKILTELDREKAQLNIYLHRANRAYHIHYQNEKLTVNELDDTNIKGTYIYISFPIGSSIYEDPNIKQTLNIKSQTYKQYLKDEPTIQKKIELLKNSNSIKIFNKDENISDFLRKIYEETFIKNIKDILIINFPTKNYEEYLKILIDIIYKEDKKYNQDTLNIAFLDDTFPKIAFIGGSNKEELCSINYKLSESYNYHKEDFTKYLGVKAKNIKSNSELFYNQDNATDKIFIPFELFLKDEEEKEYDKYIFTNMIDNYLESSDGHIDIHLDTKDTFHLNKFYYLKHIFEDSNWINRIAYALVNEIKVNYEDTDNLIFVGAWKYSAQIISIAQAILSNNNKTFIIYDNKEDLNRFDDFIKNDRQKGKHYIFFAPVILDGKYIREFTKIIKVKNRLLYCAIQIWHDKMEEQYKEFVPLLKKDVSSNIQDVNTCDDCFSGIEKPLYQLDNDKFSIKNLFIEYPKQVEYKNKYKMSWKNSIYYGHAERNTNHYLFYTKTIQFFNNNKNEIVTFLMDTKEEIQTTLNENKISIALVPMNETNHDFITLVENIIFDNDVIIHYFNLTNKEQNIYTIKTLKEKYKYNYQNCNFYFIDDEISSNNTLNYFSILLKELVNTSQEFQTIFTLIDRTHINNDIKAFKKLLVKPIKTYFENCYLCERKKYFKDLMNSSSLIFAKQQFRTKLIKLQNTNSCDIEYNEYDTIEDLKNYLKMHAIEFIYKNINNFKTHEDIEIQLRLFKNCSREYFVDKYIYKCILINYSELKIILKIIKFESKIAFIKALSFPKILYFEKIRILIHQYIINQLIQQRNQIVQNSIYTRHIDTINIKIIKVFDKLNLKLFLQIFSFKNNEDKKRYLNKTNIDYMNFLIVTSAYLKINKILNYEMIKFYYHLSFEIKKQNLKPELLHKYPIAVKMLTSYSQAKSLEFNNQLQQFISDYQVRYRKEFSLIFALFIENNKDISSLVENFNSNIIVDNSFRKNANHLQNQIHNLTKINKNKIECYVDVNNEIQNVRLINILGSFKEIENKDSIEYKLFKGAITNQKINDIQLEFDDENIYPYNIWSNYMEKLDFKTSKTYIRITSVDDENKFIPIAIIVISHSIYDYYNIVKNPKLLDPKKLNPAIIKRFNVFKLDTRLLIQHLNISRTILKEQNKIIQLIKNGNLLSGVVGEYVHDLEIKEKESKNKNAELKYKHQISKASHGAKDNMTICMDEFNGDDKTFYNAWLAYCNLIIGNIYASENFSIFSFLTDMEDVFGEDDFNNLKRYISISEKNDDKEIVNQLNKNDLIDSDIKSFYVAVFLTLLIDNSIKHGNGKIIIQSSSNAISISNEIIEGNEVTVEKKLSSKISKEPWEFLEEEKNPGITLFSLSQIFQKKYLLTTEIINNYLTIKINKEKK